MNKLTMSTRFLTPIIFNKDALATLRTFGLVNVYLDDYGHSKRYKDCLFFLFHPKYTSDFDSFEHKIAEFNSFYDYYDIETPHYTARMYVFKVHDLYRKDLFSFKSNRLFDLSSSFYEVSEPDLDLSEQQVNIQDEIYRFNLYLESVREH